MALAAAAGQNCRPLSFEEGAACPASPFRRGWLNSADWSSIIARRAAPGAVSSSLFLKVDDATATAHRLVGRNQLPVAPSSYRRVDLLVLGELLPFARRRKAFSLSWRVGRPTERCLLLRRIASFCSNLTWRSLCNTVVVSRVVPTRIGGGGVSVGAPTAVPRPIDDRTCRTALLRFDLPRLPRPSQHPDRSAVIRQHGTTEPFASSAAHFLTRRSPVAIDFGDSDASARPVIESTTPNGLSAIASRNLGPQGRRVQPEAPRGPPAQYETLFRPDGFVSLDKWAAKARSGFRALSPSSSCRTMTMRCATCSAVRSAGVISPTGTEASNVLSTTSARLRR
uniref:Uncharacterized protein n=1 Tax=Trichuris muris TaxID=70415 RepID=A0A5S6QST6_TRIMR